MVDKNDKVEQTEEIKGENTSAKKIENEASDKNTQEKDDMKTKDVDYVRQLKKMNNKELKVLFEKAKNAESYLDSLQRTKADYENYQKRVERDRANTQKFANQQLLSQFLGVLDLLKRAIDSTPEAKVEKGFLDGICLVQKEFEKVLKDAGLVAIEAVGKNFDPAYHEALRQIETDEHPDMTVIQEFETGYMLHDRVIRASRVVVSRAPKPEEKAPEPEKKVSASNDTEQKEKAQTTNQPTQKAKE